MSGTGDYDDEMFRRTTLDEDTFEQVVAGRSAAADPLLASFVEDVQLATTGPAPAAAPALATLFAEGLSTDKGDLLATAGSNVSGPAPQAAGLPKWRKKNVIEVALAKLGALGLAAKLGVASGALVLSGTAAAATGTLPDAAQDRVADAIERAGIDIPGGRSADHRQDGDRRQDGEHRPANPDASTAEAPAQADFGTGVAGDARSGAPQEGGQQFGDGVSTDARETFPPTATPTPADNPGTDLRGDAGTQQPDGTPTADDNPGADDQDGAGEQQPDGTPTADDNPGTGRRP